MRKISLTSILIYIFIFGTSCLSTYSYNAAPQVEFINQYDMPLKIKFTSFDLSKIFYEYDVPPYSSYTIEFPYNIDSFISFHHEGVYFDDFISDMKYINKYAPYQVVKPIADQGWLEIINKTDSNLYNLSFGKNMEFYTVTDVDSLAIPFGRDYSNDIIGNSIILRHFIKVSESTTDYIHLSDSYFEDSKPIGNKITVHPGEIVTVTLTKQ